MRNQKLNNNKLSVIITAAGIGRRMKSFGSKSLIELDNQTLIEHQIASVKKSYPQSEIIVVVGFQSEKIIRKISGIAKIVENELYDITNTCRSIGMGLMVASHDNAMIIHSDIMFNPASIKHALDQSFLVVDNNNNFKNNEIGVNVFEDKALCLSYGLPTKWSQIAFLTGKELGICKEITFNKDKKKMCTFEVINQIIDAGGLFLAKESKKNIFLEIDSHRDIETARRIYENCL